MSQPTPVGALGLSKQQMVIVSGACAVLLLFALIALPSSGDDTNGGLTKPLPRSDEDADDGLSNAGRSEQLLPRHNQVERPPAVVRKPEPRDTSFDEKPAGAKTPAAVAEYTPQIRYMPSRFSAGQSFKAGQTPLTMIKAGTAPLPAPPGDWDGGYGWVFVKYHPSAWELKWREEAPKVERQDGTPLCRLRDTMFSKENQIYMKELPRMTPHPTTGAQCPGSFPEQPMKFDDEVFSKFEYVYKCTLPPCKTPPPSTPGSPKIGDTKFTYIEPLVGLLRHPMACTNQYDWIINKNYMVLDPWSLVNPSRSTISPKPRVMYFDGGASVWDSGAGGASQSWFHRVYEAVCLYFTDWFMWEAGGHDPKAVFEKIPGHLKSGYRWFNVPLQTQADHWDNPMNQLLLEAKKEDIVIFKIDFDSPQIEMALIQQILDYPDVAELIDELYFEHHVNHEILKNYWGTGATPVYHSDSLKLFTALRERGVRAHSWV